MVKIAVIGCGLMGVKIAGKYREFYGCLYSDTMTIRET